MAFGLDRRGVLAGALALAACDRRAGAQAAPVDLPPLRTLAQFAIGAAVQAAQLDDPDLGPLIAAQASQLTAEWEMKMEYILQDDGAYRFDAGDRIAAFARANGQRLFGHTLVWFDQRPAAFVALDESRISFEAAYRNYIAAVVGRYRDIAVGWDVVNEAVGEQGEGLRKSLWSDKLGDIKHMVIAFQAARQADPAAILFLNDYNLESLPAKRKAFLKLAEQLLAEGAPLGGLGTQSHLTADLARGAYGAHLRDLASLGLPIHVSELDVSQTRAPLHLIDPGGVRAAQSRLYAEVAEAFSALPAPQRFGLTLWGLRDKDSWLRRENAADAPCLFDDQGRPKPAAGAFANGLR